MDGALVWGTLLYELTLAKKQGLTQLQLFHVSTPVLSSKLSWIGLACKFDRKDVGKHEHRKSGRAERVMDIIVLT